MINRTATPKKSRSFYFSDTQKFHVVFKSSKAKGNLSFYTHRKLVSKLLREKSKKFFIDIIDWVNMGNHLHLKVRFKDKTRFGQFLKSFAAMLARSITQAKKGNPFGKFWDGLVFTRVLLSKIEELGLKGYFEGNHRQREMVYRQREEYLKRFNQFIYRLRQTKARAGPLGAGCKRHLAPKKRPASASLPSFVIFLN